MSTLARDSAFYATDGGLGSVLLGLAFVAALSVGIAAGALWHRHRSRAGISKALVPSELVSLLAHDMRTPLKGALEYIEILRNTGELEASDLDALAECTHELDLLLDAALEYVRSDARAVAVREVPFALEHVIEDSLVGLRPALRRTGLDMTVALDPALPPVLVGDSRRLKQVLANVLGNAVKYTHEGAITLTVTLLDHAADDAVGAPPRVEFEVADTGPGFGSAARELMFEPFAATQHHDMGSTGLGLALVKRLVDSMGGSVEVGAETARSRGASVRIRLPFDNTGDTSRTSALVGRKVALWEPHAATRVALTRMLEGLGVEVTPKDRQSGPEGTEFHAHVVSAELADVTSSLGPVILVRRPSQPAPEGSFLETPILPGALYRALLDVRR